MRNAAIGFVARAIIGPFTPKAFNEGGAQQTQYQDAAARNGGARKHDDMMQMNSNNVNTVTPECTARGGALPVLNARVSAQARKNISLNKTLCDEQVSSRRHVTCHNNRNRYFTSS